MTRLITYTDQNMTISANICKQSALANNVGEVLIYGPKHIAPDFYKKNKEILDHPRAGYWLWKPWIIDFELQMLNDGEILIYADAGVEFVNNVNHIVDRMDQDIWLFGNMWQHLHWCKADVNEKIINKRERIFDKQVQASVIVIKKSEWSVTFIKEWLHWCQQPGMIDDSPSVLPNNPEFKEHRHDQAIICAMAYKYNLPLHWWPAMYNAGNFTYEKTGYTDTYPVLFHHFRMRNEDFKKTDDLSRHMQRYFKQRYPNIVK